MTEAKKIKAIAETVKGAGKRFNIQLNAYEIKVLDKVKSELDIKTDAQYFRTTLNYMFEKLILEKSNEKE
jgi:hypothetical protein